MRVAILLPDRKEVDATLRAASVDAARPTVTGPRSIQPPITALAAIVGQVRPRLHEGEIARGPMAVGLSLMLLALAGCSSSSHLAHSPATALGSGSAQVSIGDGGATTSNAVNCVTLGSTTRISIGNPTAGVSLVVDDARNLVAREVTINNLGGFTGSYQQDLQGDAGVGMVGATYRVAGTAVGLSANGPTTMTTERFSIAVAC